MCEYVSVYASYLTVINKHELGDIKLGEAHTISKSTCVHVCGCVCYRILHVTYRAVIDEHEFGGIQLASIPLAQMRGETHAIDLNLPPKKTQFIRGTAAITLFSLMRRKLLPTLLPF